MANIDVILMVIGSCHVSSAWSCSGLLPEKSWTRAPASPIRNRWT